VRLVIVDVRGVHVRLMTMGSMSTSAPSQGCEMALARGVFIADHLCGVGEVIVCAVYLFPYPNRFTRGVASAAVRMSDEYRFEKSDEVGFVCGGSQRWGE
jgi:hypothetical protein